MPLSDQEQENLRGLLSLFNTPNARVDAAHYGIPNKTRVGNTEIQNRQQMSEGVRRAFPLLEALFGGTPESTATSILGKVMTDQNRGNLR
jgi:hypothetical protein